MKTTINEQSKCRGVLVDLSNHMNFIEQRADKAVVVGFGEMHNGVIAKEVERYTISCNECDGDGYYDQRGEIVCEGCGMVLSDRTAVIATEFSEGDKDSMGRGRGLEKMSDKHASHEPSS